MLLSFRIKIHVSFLHILLTEELLDTTDKVKKNYILFLSCYNENGLLKLYKQATKKETNRFSQQNMYVYAYKLNRQKLYTQETDLNIKIRLQHCLAEVILINLTI
jgi:hypothetical protein